jgi:predicted ester cyclase
MSTDDSKALTVRYFEAGDRNELDLWDELCAPDMVLYPGFMEPVRGLDAIKQFTAGFHQAFSDFYLRIEDVVAEDDKVAVRMTTGGTHTAPMLTPNGEIPPTGKQIAMSGISIVRVAGGKIVEERPQMDILGFMQQLGVIPAPAGA